MGRLFLILILSACSHETTTMDRELALKLADRPVTVISGQPSIVNVNIGGRPEQVSSCYETPIYGISGEFLRNDKQCR